MPHHETAYVVPADPSTREIDVYAMGACHVFAIACHLRHEGSFVIALDTSEDHWTDENGDTMMHPVLHVFAKLEGPDGTVLRDIFGDRAYDPNDESDLIAEIAERFNHWEQDILLEDADALTLLSYIADEEGNAAADLRVKDDGEIDPEDRPLSGYEPDFLAETAALARVIAAPGSVPRMMTGDVREFLDRAGDGPVKG